MSGGYIVAFKTEPDLCNMSCPCTVDSSEGCREIAADADFERTADAASGREDSDG